MTEKEFNVTEKYLELLKVDVIELEESNQLSNNQETNKALDDIKFINKQVKFLFKTCKEKTISDILNVTMPFIMKKIEEYELKNGEILVDNYFADKSIPMILVLITDMIQSMLPNSCKLRKDHWTEFLSELIGRFNPEYMNDVLKIERLSSILVPTTNNNDDDDGVAKKSKLLSKTDEEWLVYHAKQMLDRHNQAITDEKPPILQVDEINHLSEIKKGNIPQGYNTPSNHRWAVIDMTTLLKPGGFSTEKKISKECYNFLLSRANTIKKQLNKKLNLTEQEREQLDHVSEIVTSGTLPLGFHI